MTLTRLEYPSLVLQCFSMTCDTIQFEKERACRLSIVDRVYVGFLPERSSKRIPGILPCDPVKYEQTPNSFYDDK